MEKESEIIADLRNRLVIGQFEPGQRLQPEKLRTIYGCSASALREALFRLSTEDLVDFQEQRGFRVPRLSAQLLHELTLLRILLECEGACLSIRHGGVEWEARLSAAHHKLSHIESRVRGVTATETMLSLWTRAELEFHQTLIDASESQLLLRTHRTIYMQFRQQLIKIDRAFVFVTENVRQHKAILDAALDRDQARVRQRIYDHLSRNLMQPAAQPA